MDIQAQHVSDRAVVGEVVEALDASTLRDIIRKEPFLKLHACHMFCSHFPIKHIAYEKQPSKISAVLEAIIAPIGRPQCEDRYCLQKLVQHLSDDTTNLFSIARNMISSRRPGEGCALFIIAIFDNSKGYVSDLQAELMQGLCQAVLLHRSKNSTSQENSSWASVHLKASSARECGNDGEGSMVLESPEAVAEQGTAKICSPRLFMPCVRGNGFLGDLGHSDRVGSIQQNHTEKHEIIGLAELLALYAASPELVLRHIAKHRVGEYMKILISMAQSFDHGLQIGKNPSGSITQFNALLSHFLLHIRTKWEERSSTAVTDCAADRKDMDLWSTLPSSSLTKVKHSFDGDLEFCSERNNRLCVSGLGLRSTANISKFAIDIVQHLFEGVSGKEVDVWCISQLCWIPVLEVRKALDHVLWQRNCLIHQVLHVWSSTGCVDESRRRIIDEVFISALETDGVLPVLLNRSKLIAITDASWEPGGLRRFMRVLNGVCTRADGKRLFLWRGLQHIFGILQSRYAWELLRVQKGSPSSHPDAHKEYIQTAEHTRHILRENDPLYRDTFLDNRICLCRSVECKSGIDFERTQRYPEACSCDVLSWMFFSTPSAKDWFLWTFSDCCRRYRSASNQLETVAHLEVRTSLWISLQNTSTTGSCSCHLFQSVTEAVLNLSMKWELMHDGPFDGEKMLLLLTKSVLNGQSCPGGNCFGLQFRQMENCVAKAVVIKGAVRQVSSSALVKIEELERRMRAAVESLWQCRVNMCDQVIYPVREVLMQELHSVERMLRMLFLRLEDLGQHHSEMNTFLESAFAIFEYLFGSTMPGPDFTYLRVLMGYRIQKGSVIVVKPGASNLSARISGCFL